THTLCVVQNIDQTSQIFLVPLPHTVPSPSHCSPSITLFPLHHTVPPPSHCSPSITLFPLHHTVPPPSHCSSSITLFLLHHTVSSQAKIKEDKALSCDVFQHSHSRLTQVHSSKVHPTRALPLKLQVGR